MTGARLLPVVALLVLAFAALLWRGAGAAQSLEADLSSHLIAITTGFTGSEVVLFGAVDGPGEVAVVVVGPKTRATVRRKERVGGVWMNRRSAGFEQVPVFYALATSRPLAALVGESVLVRNEIGLDRLPLNPVGFSGPPAEAASFREALIRGKLDAGLYSESDGQVRFLGKRLFRTTIFFPANVATGIYTVSVFLFRDRDVASASTTPLVISKTGLSAEISEFATERPALYGLTAVLGAFLIGWAAGSLFRKL
ncbi:MAG: TIGR02186 family protein [Rhodospirillaceae bacterium]